MGEFSFALIQRYQGSQVRNVLNYETGQSSILGLQQHVDYFRSAWVASGIVPNLKDDWRMTGAEVRDLLVSRPGVEYQFTEGDLVGGDSIGGGVAAQVSLLISWLSNAIDFPNRGRTYLCGFENTTITSGGQWTGEVQSQAQDLADSLLEPDVAGETFMGLRIVRRGVGGLLLRSNPVDTAVVRSIPAIQRRRRKGQGE